MIDITRLENENNDSTDKVLIKAGFKYLKFEREQDEYEVTLIDDGGYEIIKGYGKSTVEAINDMHKNLI